LEIDWRARVVHAEPVVGDGVARWDGSGAVLSAALARGVRSVLAGADPSGVQLSRRAAEQLAALRAARPWVREGATTLKRDEKGRLYWWTFAGDVANWWLAGAFESYRHGQPGPDSYRIALDPESPMEEVREFIRGLGSDDLRLEVGVGGPIAKFSELVPLELARAMATKRLASDDATRTLSDPCAMVAT
jgi:ATP-dependent Lhr-like helicase